ncbi:MAG: phosphoglucosamine mutase [Actinomycetota bacterium]|nr:phosphoglucosamine mutase [Actinomycetota bacterium]
MTLKFGTDGVRGVANQELTPELVVALGRAAAEVLGGTTFLLGRDTRVSGPLLQAALSAGLASEGVSVVDLGVLPTPGVAFASAMRGNPAAVISASHNPFPDNGIKLFAAGGRKLPDDVEEVLESRLTQVLGGVGGLPGSSAPTGESVGRLDTDGGALDEYVTHLVGSLEGRRLDHLRVVLDCANGAAFEAAPRALVALGAEVEVMGHRPDGTNINDGCGSTFPMALQRAVVTAGADVGLALDGDADRVLAVDGQGGLVDGDQLLALCAQDLRSRGRLREDTVVVTVMTNLGFRHAMSAQGIAVQETAVGDRYVLEALERGGWSLGGEQSGHLIFRELATTGDGTLTGLMLLDLLRRHGRPLAELAAEAMTRLPQVLRNVRLAVRDPDVVARLRPAIEAAEAELDGEGRVLVRASGTEPLVRVMVEAPTEQQAEEAVARLVADVERTCGVAPA